jgi:excisionase family DNA binding protein
MKATALLTADELSQILNISEFTVKKLAKTRQLPCTYVGRQPRFNLYKVLEYFQRLEGGAA